MFTTNVYPHRIAITGGIGSGKSYVCHLIMDMGYPVFNCDDWAKKIIQTDLDVRDELMDLVGENVFHDGVLNKAVLATYLCQGPDYAKHVNSIVHPRVAKAFSNWTKSQSSDLVFMECALLFESGFDKLVDNTIVIQTPEELRIQRVMNRDGVSYEKVLNWIQLQMPEDEKAQRADFIIYNEPKYNLQVQLEECLRTLLG